VPYNLFLEMTSTAAVNPVEILANVAVEQLQHLREEKPATMSRGRFVVMQLNSLVIAVLTCLSMILFWILNRVESLNELVAGPCGIGSLLLQNLTGLPPNTLCNNTN
jgi:hypothetical protein